MPTTLIDELVTQAARSNTKQDSDALFKALRGQEIFFWVRTEKKIDPTNGQEREVAVSSPLLRLPAGQRAFMLYTSREDARLRNPYGGAQWERALRMLTDMNEADGLILTSPNKDSIAVDKQNAHDILKMFGLSRVLPRAQR